ncbi:predicted protein [Nematostella vectensis]|uniref:beta-N-acetylhexosaminidase n=1 Tax=Nematostella vectensis TaxID=45351 RepID=A7SK38_NEMVE|nr:predicted protein [Nematostella vectensis]|eukprot:XP_001628009.1 predicted protein [Nematostella vectensis]
MSRATEYNHCRLVTGVLAFAVAWCVSYGDTNRSAPSATRDTLSRDTVLFNVTKEIAKARQSLQAVTVKLNQAEVRLIQIAKNIQKRPEHRGFLEHKLVHLDFNGAPPRMSYLLELVPFLRSWGATGFLIEYVDMFPFTGNLQFLTSQEAYRSVTKTVSITTLVSRFHCILISESGLVPRVINMANASKITQKSLGTSREEILQFQSACSSYGLIVIPLVQTFGHLEYALRHPRLAHLRETARYTNVLCPNKEGSVPLIKEIIDQVADLHPHSQWLHVGGDEVYNLKTCESCKMDVRNKSAIFLHHMLPVLRHVSNRNLSAIIWDDMMRDWELPQLSLMKGLVEPMLWGYKPTLQGYFSQAMLERYVVVFPRVWLASAFKGAHKPFADFVPIRDRLDNNLKYLELAASLPKETKVMGIALTLN